MKRKEESTFSKKINIEDIASKKGKLKITMLTCYDTSFAVALDEAGVDIILVGDSLANVILGMERTKNVSFREMFNHTKAVKKSVKEALVVADMPYVSYQKNRRKTLYYAKRFIEEAGADAVKLEWFKHCPEAVKMLVKNGIAVMGHVGLTPQTVDRLGGFRIQGKDAYRAQELIKEACLLEELGVFSIVIECVPSRVAKLITDRLKIPTIGIGAGKFCDGQVLVLYDILCLYKRAKPKFVRPYLDLYSKTKDAISKFVNDVRTQEFPASGESFSMKDEEFNRLVELIKKEHR